MTSKRNHLITASIGAIALTLGVGLFALVHFNYKQNQQVILDYHRAESIDKFHEVSGKVENVFQQTYQCLRTIARLPGVRELTLSARDDPEFHGGEGIERNTRLNIQEIYNNLGSNIAVSELYIVPVNLDPDAPESDAQAARKPLATFDHLIVGRQGGAETNDNHPPVELEEIEIYEYRLIKKQLAWLKKHCPREADINALNYPMIGGPQVVTCDNRYFDPSAPDDLDRSGMVLSVPYYGSDGDLLGCISAVILTRTLQDILPDGNYTITNAAYNFCVPPRQDGQWRDSYEYASTARKDPGLLVSMSDRIQSREIDGAWSMWMGHPDTDYWESPDVRATARSRNLAYGFVSLIILTAICGACLVLRGRRTIIRINQGLERSIQDQTVELESTLSELKYQKLAQDEHAIVSIADIRGDIIYTNDKFCELSGYSREELIGQNHSIVRSGEHSRDFYRDLWKTISQGNVWRGEIENRAKNGSHYWVDATIVPFKDEHGKTTQYVAIRTDITAMKESELRYKLAVNGSRDGLWDWNLLTDRVYYAPQWKRMLGLGPEDEVADSPEEWISRIDQRDVGVFMQEFDEHLRGEDETFEVELRMAHKDGRTVWMLCRGAVVRDKTGRAIRVAGSMADITEIKDAQDKLRRLSEQDRLTALPNRELFKVKLDQSIQRAQANPDLKFAVLFFDFDRFKIINDSLGHNVGDALLVDIARLFEYSLRHGDTAARFGGDEFVVLLNDLSDFNEAHQAAERLLEAFARPHNLMGHSVTSTASIGLVTNEQGYVLAEDMIRDADAAMYQAKEAGKAQVVVFDQAMHERAMDRLRLESDLRLAVPGNQLQLLYQPIVELGTGELSGFEALVRWQHPTRGMISPADFIPIAEDTGLIVEIGKWVFQTASRQIADWNRRLSLRPLLSMNINVSKRQILSPTFVDDVIECQRQHGLHSRELKIEITESLVSDSRADIAPILHTLRGQGCLIAMDDFGTGVSSLSTLHEYPIDILKIDQSFIRDLDSDRSLLAVVASITSLAENLGIRTVAEGVETSAVVVALQSIDCTWAQGYHFAKPLTASDAEAYILGMFESKQSA